MDCSVDLEKDVNMFGRGTSNDFCFEQRAFRKNPNYQAISTKHFKLFRVCICILIMITAINKSTPVIADTLRTAS